MTAISPSAFRCHSPAQPAPVDLCSLSPGKKDIKKILLAFDGVHFSEGAFEFALRLNLQEPILLTGVFLPLYSYASLWSYSDTLKGIGAASVADEDKEDAVKGNIRRFEDLCERNGIS